MTEEDKFDPEKNPDIHAMVAKNPDTGEKQAIAYSVKEYHRMYVISLILLIAVIAAVIIAAIALIKFWPFLLKLDTGNWLTRLTLTCRECAACV